MKPDRVLIVLVAVSAMALLGGSSLWPSHPASAQTTASTDYDTDDDGLIEVGSLAQLNVVRYDLDGDGSPTNSAAYVAAFPSAATGMGCPSSGCTGYELTANLDFDTNGDGRTDIAGDDYWNGGAGWKPIDGDGSGYQNQYFHATFEGNSHVISGLYIDRSEQYVGFFGSVWGGEIRNLGLEDVVIKGGDGIGDSTGGLVGNTTSGGSHSSLISASYVTGSVTGGTAVGGLVGFNQATINASYVSVSVSGNVNVGGLVGTNHSSGAINASYATGSVTGGAGYGGGLVGSNQSGSITASYSTSSLSGRFMGGLVGVDSGGRGTFTVSYWDTETSGQSSSAGGVGKTTSELQSPTGYTGIYADWNVDLDADGVGDDPWDFGTKADYPVFDYNPSETAAPMPPGAPAIGAITSGTGALAISWTAPTSDGGSAITAYDLRHIETSADETVDSNWIVVDDVWATGDGSLQYTLTGLTGGKQYDLQVRAANAGGDGPWSATATGTPTPAIDYDADDDGLIEVGSLAQLDAIRHDLNGDGFPANSSPYNAAFPNAAAGMGCPSPGCTGYELTANLDFDTNGDGRTDVAGDIYWDGGSGWEPIGRENSEFGATFEGNDRTIANLHISRNVSGVGPIRVHVRPERHSGNRAAGG